MPVYLSRPEAERRSPYGVMKRIEILSALAVEEQQELERLEHRQRRSSASEARRAELWRRAHELHVPPQQDPLFAYTRHVGEDMTTRGANGGS